MEGEGKASLAGGMAEAEATVCRMTDYLFGGGLKWEAGGPEGGEGGRVCCRPCSPEVAEILGCVPGREQGDGRRWVSEEHGKDPGAVSAGPHFLARWCHHPAPRFLSHEMRSKQHWARKNSTYFSEPQV